MFNGMFNDGGYNENGGCLGGCNCTWVLLLVLFLCCCGGKIKNFNLTVNPTCLLLMVAMLVCCGGISVGNGK